MMIIIFKELSLEQIKQIFLESESPTLMNGNLFFILKPNRNLDVQAVDFVLKCCPS